MSKTIEIDFFVAAEGMRKPMETFMRGEGMLPLRSDSSTRVAAVELAADADGFLIVSAASEHAVAVFDMPERMDELTVESAAYPADDVRDANDTLLGWRVGITARAGGWGSGF